MLSSASIVLLSLAAAVDDEPDQTWGQWRGPLASGWSPDATPPLEWSDTEHVRWKTPVPGFAHSSPIVWGDRVYLTTAIAFGAPFEPTPDTAPGAHDNTLVSQRHRFEVLAFAREDGRLLWRTPVAETIPHEGGHVTGSLASASPCTNGTLVFASFGSRGIFALSPDGALVWSRDLGRMETKHAHGEGASPCLFDDTLLVPWDHEGPSRLIALDANTGDVRWEQPRDEPTSWSTPIVTTHDGVHQVVVSGTNRVRGYDLRDGHVLWECGGLSHNVVASPVAHDGIVIAGSSYEKQSILAVALEGASGDVTETDRLLWFKRRRTPYVPSLLLVDGSILMLHHYQGVLSQIQVSDGHEPHRPLRLPGITHVYASPVSAAGHLFITDQCGDTLVLKHGTPPEPLHINRLGEPVDASLALVGTQLFIRSHRHLFCIDASTDAQPPSDGG